MSVGKRRLSRSIQSLKREVFAHYFTPFPISIDNTEPTTDSYETAYLDPHGENDKHVAYGGFLRERPLPQQPSLSPSWQIDNYKIEITRAYQAGITGFTVDILSITPGNYLWQRFLLVLQAVHESNLPFKIVLMPDSNGDATDNPLTLADSMLAIINGPFGGSIFRAPDGRVVVSPFYPEARGVAYWRDQFMPRMEAGGEAVAFVPCFLDYFANVNSFNSFSYGFSIWGDRSPLALNNITIHANDAHARSKIWMSPVAFQDTRPYSGGYQEACNTETLRGMWQKAIDTKSEWVQILTWNDYSENTQIAPSTHIGWVPLKISAYFSASYIHGSPPPIDDVLYLSHRIQPHSAQPSFPQTVLMEPYQYASPPRDTVEVLTFLSSPQTINLKVGTANYSYLATAGVDSRTYPLGVGSIQAEITYSGSSPKSVTSPYIVTNTPYIQDLNYYMSHTL